MFVAKKKALPEKKHRANNHSNNKIGSKHTTTFTDQGYRQYMDVGIFIALASSGDSGEPAYLRSLARAFTACTNKVGA